MVTKKIKAIHKAAYLALLQPEFIGGEAIPEEGKSTAFSSAQLG